MNITIEKVVNNGYGLGRYENKVVFVPYVLPEEEIEIDIIEEKNKLSYGRINEIIKPSKLRIQPDCEFFTQCGGCFFRELSYHNYLDLKYKVLVDTIRDFFDTFPYEIPLIIKTNPLYYRNTVRLKVNGSGTFGFNKFKDNAIIPIDYCYISDKKIDAFIQKFNYNLFKGVNEIVLKVDNNDNLLLQLIVEEKIKFPIEKLIIEEIIDGIYINNEHIYGKSYLQYKINNYNIQAVPMLFYQTNYSGLNKVLDLLKQYLVLTKNRVVFDLYSGVGVFSLFVHDRVKKVYAIEKNKYSVAALKETCKRYEIDNIEPICNDTDTGLSGLYKKGIKPDTIIVDPPRTGLNKKVIDIIIKMLPKELVYISCDLTILLRDLKLFQSKFKIHRFYSVDMFPYTDSFENVVFLRPKIK